MNISLDNLNALEINKTDVARVATIKVLVFNINNLNLGVRIETVYKVLNATQIYRRGNNWVGIAHIGDREVTVLDLHQRLFAEDKTNENPADRYLIVIQNKQNELYGIPVETVPALIDLPVSAIRVLPESFRQADSLGIASHVAVLTEADNSITLFMLDIDSTTNFY